MLAWLRPDDPFPPIEHALAAPNGLLAAGSDLSPARIVDAYRRGIFPWYSEGQPVLWWSPDPRMVLRTADFRVSRSLARRVRERRFGIRVDTAFERVIRGCAGPRAGQEGTWITAAMIDAYVALHRAGFAHSVEAWRGEVLAGGLYGIALGRVFFGESMFAREADASKVALVHLVAKLRRDGVPLIDCQQETAHLASFGARPVGRRAFAAELARLIHCDAPPAPWQAGTMATDETTLP
ncbi:MAG TPA: leucyl/phenylalanyl-tRNA--protein transferase [Casimicrobiaceae bacterium]|nr:leucyl/phenylalanyl-tRNA--protein transferase [Casimicrobiaceae bacterium]